MDKVLSTRVDEAVARTLDDLAASLRIPKKRIVEDAIRLYSETLEHKADPIDASFGAWRRSDAPDELHRGMRAAFESAMHRHRE
jgi:predicted transcriptional regulator